MKSGSSKFAKQTRAAGFFAEVSVELEPAQSTAVAVETEGAGFRGQGQCETVPAHGYELWKQGAIIGVRFALAAVHREAMVRVTRLAGLTTDTNASIVAAAAAGAVWAALNVDPPQHAHERVERVALESWADSVNELLHLERGLTH